MNIVCPMRITYHMSNWMSNWIHLCLRWMLLCHCRFFSNIVCIYLSILSCLSRKYKKLLIVLISFKGFRGMNFHWHLCKLSLLRWLIVLGIKRIFWSSLLGRPYLSWTLNPTRLVVTVFLFIGIDFRYRCILVVVVFSLQFVCHITDFRILTLINCRLCYSNCLVFKDLPFWNLSFTV